MTDNYIFIELKHLESMFKRDRQIYLKNLSNNAQLVRLEPKDPAIILSRLLTYSIEKNDFMFSAGIIPVKIHNLWSYAGFELRVAVKTDFKYRMLEENTETHA
jgi:hypothetical protein